MHSSADGIMRFPRIGPGNGHKRHLSKVERLELAVAQGKTPRGYDHLDKRQKKLVKLVLDGMTVGDACRKMGVEAETFYRWRRAHVLFREYYYKIARRRALNIDSAIDAKLPRAVRVMEDALDSADEYFAYEAAKDLLKGRGKFKQNISSKQEVGGHVNIEAKGKFETKLDDSVVLELVKALVGKAQGQVVDVTATPVKLLPEKT